MPSSRSASRASTSSPGVRNRSAASGIGVWVEATRPRTLAASVVPVLVGTAAAERLIAWRFAAALVVALALQVAVNYANDYFDAVKGVDTPARLGPRRATASGLVTRSQMTRAIAVALGVAVAAGVALSSAAGWELLVAGALSIAAALAYSGGPRPYGSRALGEFFVFAFFGVVATVGSAYVQAERIVDSAVAASIPVGFIATAILIANNLRDVESDRTAGKITLAVKLGRGSTRGLYRGLLIGAFVAVPLVAWFDRSWWPLVALGAAPLAYPAFTLIRGGSAGELIGALGATARLHLVFGVLLAVGLWI